MRRNVLQMVLMKINGCLLKLSLVSSLFFIMLRRPVLGNLLVPNSKFSLFVSNFAWLFGLIFVINQKWPWGRTKLFMLLEMKYLCNKRKNDESGVTLTETAIMKSVLLIFLGCLWEKLNTMEDLFDWILR